MNLTERNPLIIGLVAIAVILAGTLAALTVKRDTFAPGYTITANFRDTAGLSGGDRVTTAGVLIGSVSGIKQDGSTVRVSLKINHGIQVAQGSTANIKVESLLGRKAVALTPPANADWTKLMKGGDHIPGLGGSPTEVLDVQSDAETALATLDTNALNTFLADLAQVTVGKRDQVNSIIDGLNRLTSTVNGRQAQVSSLIDAANAVSATVESRNANLLSAIDNLNVVISNLNSRRQQLTALLASTQEASNKLAALIGSNQPQLAQVLRELQSDLAVVDQHQVDLATTLSYLAGAVQGFSSVGYSGPANTPNTWANIYTVGVGPVSGDPTFGCGGTISSVLSIVVGPDPVTSCAQYTGPIPGGVASGAPTHLVNPAQSLPPGTTGSVDKPTAGSTADGLNTLLVPLLSGVK